MFRTLLWLACLSLFFHNNNEQALTKVNTTQMKGILQIMIILHHISQKISHPWLIPFENAGMFGVSGFFFITVYGLGKQISLHGSDYQKNFIKKRWVPLFVSVAVTTIFYFLVRNLYFHEKIDFSRILFIYKTGSSIIANGWYLSSILIIYLLFHFSFKWSKNNYHAWGIFACSILFYTGLLIKLNFGVWWVNANGVLLLAILYVHSETYIWSFWQKYRWILLPTVLILVYELEKYGYDFIRSINFPYIYILLQNVITCTFIIALVLIFQKFSFRHPWLEWLGQYSLELYISQGLVIWILVPWIQSAKYLVSLTFIFTILLSIGAKQGFQKIHTLLETKRSN